MTAAEPPVPADPMGPAEPTPSAEPASAAGPRVVVRRQLPTDPQVRASAGLFLTEAARQGVAADRRMLFVGLEPAGDQIAGCLRVAPSDDVLARRKLLLADGVPVRVATSYLRADLFAQTRLADPGFVRPSLQAALRDLGHSFGRAEEILVARPATAAERATLELDPGEWVVQIIRASYARDDTPVHTLETICAATRHVFPITQLPGDQEF